MRTWTTPGVDFLARNLAWPAAVHYVALGLTARLLALHPVPTWILLLSATLLVPIRLIADQAYVYRIHLMEARARGARLPPVIDSRSLGNWKLLLRVEKAMTIGYPGDEFWDFVKEQGPTFNLRLMFADVICTISPDHLKRVLATEFDKFGKGERFIYAFKSVLGTGIFNSDGEMWKFHRSLARPFFSKERVRDLERLDKHILKAVALLKQRMRKGYAIDLQDLLSRVSMDAASENLFGASLKSLETSVDDLPQPFNHPLHHESVEAFSKHPSNAFSEAFIKASWIGSQRDRIGWIWPLFEIFGDRTKKYTKILDAFLNPIIQTVIERKAEKQLSRQDEKDGNEIGEDDSLLDHIARHTSDTSVMKDQALNALLAGRDTIASTATFMLCLLAQHPIVFSRLRREILEKVGPTRRPTYEDVKDMKFLRAVINETLRVLPPVPWNVRDCIEGTVWPSPEPGKKPIYIPPGAAVMYSVLMMHTNEELWGPDAAMFDPDRWLDERKKHLLANPFIFLPFNGGPRICLGQQLAYNTISIMAVRLLQSFDSFSLQPEACPPNARVPDDWKEGRGRKAMEAFRPAVVLAMTCEGGLWLKARPVDDHEAEED